MIHDARIKHLNSRKNCSGQYVLYWMQASQRTICNHALEYAIRRANELKVPVIVFFMLVDNYPDANSRHFRFMLEGLKETGKNLANMGIQMLINRMNDIQPNLFKKAIMTITDCGYTRFQRKTRNDLAKKLTCPLIQVESEVIVPVETASSKEEYSAATLRRKISPLLNEYLVPLTNSKPKIKSSGLKSNSINLEDIEAIIRDLNIKKDISPSSNFKGGYSQAKKILDIFIKSRIAKYDECSNDPSQDYQSNLSPYLHFGQISSLEIALTVIENIPQKINAGFLEELIVRRELAVNFTFYNPDYDKYSSLPEWALKTLSRHEKDKREYLYSRKEFEQAATHDPYWNCAQQEMVVTGKMHGYMRMYWGKKIIEWSESPEEAFKTALYLNNKYELDGRDPNGFAGVAWCFGKHDRAWTERPIFGKIRFMNANGLKRKFNIDKYVEKTSSL